MGKSKVLLPRKLAVDPAAMARVIANTLNARALDIKVDFGVTVASWEHSVTFSVTSPSTYERIVSTEDDIYRMLNKGTPAHRIEPKGGGVLRFTGPFRAKTVPNSISSRSGNKGSAETFSRGVNHPGTEARNWNKAIAKKWRRLVGPLFQRAIDSEVGR